MSYSRYIKCRYWRSTWVYIYGFCILHMYGTLCMIYHLETKIAYNKSDFDETDSR